MTVNFNLISSLEAAVQARTKENEDYRIPICVKRALESRDPSNPAILQRCIRRVIHPSTIERFKDFVRRILRRGGGYTDEEFQSALKTAKSREKVNATNAAIELNRLRGATLTTPKGRQDMFSKDMPRAKVQIGSITMNRTDTSEKFEEHLKALNGEGELPSLLLENLYIMCQHGPLGTVVQGVNMKFAEKNMIASQKSDLNAPFKVTVVKNRDSTWTVTVSKLAELRDLSFLERIVAEIELRTEMRFSADGQPLCFRPSFQTILPPPPQPLSYQISSMR